MTLYWSAPRHVTQRGNRRMTVFFSDDDDHLYLDLLAAQCRKAGVDIWSYCLALGETHRRHSGVVNARLRVTGHLCQACFGSAAMVEAHLAKARYVALNPVRARLVANARDWRWSSARAHLAGQDDAYVKVAPLLDRCAGLIETPADPALLAALRAAETIGCPLGADMLLNKVEALTGRATRPAKRGPKAKLSAMR